MPATTRSDRQTTETKPLVSVTVWLVRLAIVALPLLFLALVLMR